MLWLAGRLVVLSCVYCIMEKRKMALVTYTAVLTILHALVPVQILPTLMLRASIGDKDLQH